VNDDSPFSRRTTAVSISSRMRGASNGMRRTMVLDGREGTVSIARTSSLRTLEYAQSVRQESAPPLELRPKEIVDDARTQTIHGENGNRHQLSSCRKRHFCAGGRSRDSARSLVICDEHRVAGGKNSKSGRIPNRTASADRPVATRRAALK